MRLLLLLLASIPAVHAQRIPVHAVGGARGLPEVYSIDVGVEGLWMATAAGVSRYDGVRVLDEPLGIDAPQGALKLTRGPDGRVWAWAPPHLLAKRPGEGFRPVAVPPELAESLRRVRWTSITLAATAGGVTVGSERDGVWQWRPGGWKRILDEPTRHVAASGQEVWLLTRDRVGRIGTSGRVEWLYEGLRAPLHVLPHPRGAWITTEFGLYLLLPDDDLVEVLPTSVRCWFTTPDVQPDGTLALTVETSGLAVWMIGPDGNVVRRIGAGNGLRAMTLSGLAFDGVGGVFGSSKAGVDHLPTLGQIERFPVSETHDISGARLNPADGSLWTTTYGGGVVRILNGERRVIRTETEEARIAASLALDSVGVAHWIEIDPASGRGTAWSSDGRAVTSHGSRPIPIFRREGTEYWVDPNERLRVVSASGATLVEEGVLSPPRGAVPNGDVWLSVSQRLEYLNGDGLASSDPDTPPDIAGILRRYQSWDVTVVVYDRFGDVWVGTRQGVLLLSRSEGRWMAMEVSTRRPELGAHVDDMDVDGDRLLVATNQGLWSYRISPRRALTPEPVVGWEAALTTRAVRRVRVGLDGTIWLLGAGLPTWVAFKVPTETPAGSMRLSAVSVNDRRVLDLQRVRSDTSRIALAFAPAGFGDATSIEYRINGGAWVPFLDDPTLRLTSLDPGRYTVEARMRGIAGAPGAPLAVAFVVTPPFYRAGWFYGLLILALSVGVALWVRERSRQAQARESQLEAVVTERTEELARSLDLVESQTQELREADRAKSQFFAAISHELRTPLTLLLGPIRDAESGAATSLEGLIPSMRRNGERLLRLIDNLLDLSRLESGALHLDRQPTDLGPWVRGLAEAFSYRAEQTGVDLNVEAEAPVYADVDRERVERIVFNLLDNAFRHCSSGDRVTVRVFRQDAVAVLEVADTGEGIPHEALPHVFDRFRQVDEARHARGSLGLGLALVREWAEAHDGSVEVESVLGLGTRFRVRLVGTSDGAVPSLSSTSEQESRPDKHLRQRPDIAADVPLVLIVDDHHDVRAYVSDRIATQYRVLEAADGLDGLDSARLFRPDLIVSDVMMPGMSGVELCREIREDAALAATPVILLTARADDDILTDGLAVGADDVLTKPFRTDELLLRIENLIEVRRHVRGSLGLATPPPEDTWVRTVRQSVEAALGDPDFSVERLAEVVSMSTRSMQRRLKESTGLSPSAYIRTIRLEHAHARLARGGETVREVAAAVGFNDPAYFARVFRQAYGYAPSAARDDA